MSSHHLSQYPKPAVAIDPAMIFLETQDLPTMHALSRPAELKSMPLYEYPFGKPGPLFAPCHQQER